jgi:hypothetical protein
MRRLFWVGTGALIGVAGYRRVTRLVRTVSGAGRPAAAPGSAWMDGAARFARDVRDGMELYADRHPGLTGRTLEGRQARAAPPPTGAAGARSQHRRSQASGT